MSSTQVTPLGSYRGSSPALERRGWNLALGFQEIFTAVVRLRYKRQAVLDAEIFRAQMRQALRAAEQEARSRGCSAEHRKRSGVFAGRLELYLHEVRFPRMPCEWCRQTASAACSRVLP